MGSGTLKTVSCKAILGEVARRFQIQNSEYLSGGIESIGLGLEIIGLFGGYVTKPIEACVTNYKCKIPCEVSLINWIADSNGNKLRPLDMMMIGLVRNPKENQSSFTRPELGTNWYTLNPNYIHTGFESGEILIYADCIPLDCDGFPLVPDNPNIREALSWRVLMDVLSRGYKHPVFNYEDAEKRWELHYPRAQNSMIGFTINDMERFKKMWTMWTVDLTWNENGRSFLSNSNGSNDATPSSNSFNSTE